MNITGLPGGRLNTVLATAALFLSLAPPSATAAAPSGGALPPGALVASPRMAVPAAAAAGALAPSGCARDGSTATCDLYAQEGTAQILGQPVPIWGFSSTGDPGSATAPGPVLVVRQGDTVNVTLHNQLADDVSLTFPGQPADAFSAGLSAADQTAGAASGGTATYTFTATHAGTFLYEAGHTPGGARQVAMGLAGALVVLGDPGTADGQAYDDEAVVVLSEIDPELNAHPGSFDMRTFRPRYRLINGQPFPATDPIATDQGHRVLLRYVNVGSSTHPMSLLGADQLQLAQDGHPMDRPESEVVAPVEAGATVDTLVTMPTGPEAKVTLYEAGGHLDNNGQTGNDPSEVALGGMMTFLDTNAQSSGTDEVGPVPAHVTVSPNPSDGQGDVTVTADLSDAKTGGSPVEYAELVVDDAVTVAVGNGVPMGPESSFGTVTVTGLTAQIPAQPAAGQSCTDAAVPVALSCLDAGRHVVYVRGRDAAGKWGVVGSAVLNLPKTGPMTRAGSLTHNPANGSQPVRISTTGDDSDAEGTITAAEYFVDTLGAPGTGEALAVNLPRTVAAEDATIPAGVVDALPEGEHHVFVRSKNALGLWGPDLDIPLTVDKTGPKTEPVEVAPSITNGVLSSPGNPGNLVVSGVITDRDAGSALQSRIVDAEGFLDPPAGTPAVGSGFQLIASDGKMDSQTESVYGLIPISQVRPLANGTYHVYVRGQDEAGNWGDLAASDLTIDKTAPVLQSLQAAPNPTRGAAAVVLTAPVVNDTTFANAEYWTGNGDPGAGNATQVSVSFVNGSIVVTVPLTGIRPGLVPFHLRVQDKAGNWSNAVQRTVVVTRANAILADSFNTGNLALWSQRVGPAGALGVSTAAGLPAGGGNQGLGASLPGSRRNAGAFVTDASPSGETGYHARFAFDPHTLRDAGAPAVTVFQARSSSRVVFRVDFRRTAAGRQLRPVMTTSTGQALAGAWRTVSAGAHTVRVDWLSGPATGAGAGSLRLQVDRATTQVRGRTVGLRVESVRLGIVSGFARSSAGTAWFDRFESARTNLP